MVKDIPTIPTLSITSAKNNIVTKINAWILTTRNVISPLPYYVLVAMLLYQYVTD